MSIAIRLFVFVAAVLVCWCLPATAEDGEIDSIMYRDPHIEPVKTENVFSPRLKPLWLEALARPEVDLKRQAAETIARAYVRGMPGLEDTSAPLAKELDAPDAHPLVRLTAARALIVLGAKEAAPSLFKHAQSDGLSMAQIIEPALADWDYRPARTVWLARLEDAQASRSRQLLAIRCLSLVGEQQAVTPLLNLATAPHVAADLRLEAARAAGSLRQEGLENDARRLAGDKSPRGLINRLVAASLIRQHRGEDAQALMLQLANDDEPAVARTALARLFEIDPALVEPMTVRLIAHADAGLRDVGARTLVALPTPKSIALLAPMLDDPHPDIRVYVRKSLVDLAADAQRKTLIIDEGVKMLATDKWRGLEQAAFLLVALDHKPAAPRLVELLDFPRPEVFVTSAWGLRRLAVPSTLEGMLDKAHRANNVVVETPLEAVELHPLIAQLFQAFGQMKFAKAEPLLRQYVPKDFTIGVDTRVAAIWSLGHLHAGQPDEGLASQYVGRINDTNSMPPEMEEVRTMCAISLGRMKAESTISTLRGYLESDSVDTDFGFACAWAIHQMTGEPIPARGVRKIGQVGWFLEPLGDGDQ